MSAHRYIFVIGTGRSGTRTCATYLSSIPGCVVRHEMRPRLLGEVTARFDGTLTSDTLVTLLRETRGPIPDGGERLSGESNQRLAYLLPELDAAFPDAHLLWVVRDGRDAVASMVHRHWYEPDEIDRRAPDLGPWIEHRIRGDRVGDLSADQWASMTSFERCCWYWAATNQRIERDLLALGRRADRIRLEDLSRDPKPTLAALDLPTADMPAVPRLNVSHVRTLLAHRTPLPWTAWRPVHRAAFERWAGPTMDHLYPDWRADWEAADGRGRALRMWRRSLGVVAGRSRPLRTGLARWTTSRASENARP